MFNKITHFIKYNNATIFILAFILVLGGSAFASEAGREAIGGKESSIEGVDNTLLLAADLESLDMEFKIEKIEEDDEKYYVTYTFLDLANINSAWQYQIKEKLKTVSKKSAKDLAIYLAEEFKEEYEDRVSDLKKEKEKANSDGPQKRVEVEKYVGLAGKILDTGAKVFIGYDPVKKKEIESPVPIENFRKLKNKPLNSEYNASPADDLSRIYEDYITENDPDVDNFFGTADNCPDVYNPDQADSNGNGIGDACDGSTESNANDTSSSDAETGDDLSDNSGSVDSNDSSDEDLFVEVVDLEDIQNANTGASNDDAQTQTETDGTGNEGDQSEDAANNVNSDSSSASTDSLDTIESTTPAEETGD